MPQTKKIPRKYQPRGFEIIYEDRDIIVGDKAPGFLTVSARWNKDQTIHAALNQYVRKGSARSHKSVYAVHRLDQDTSGVLMYAKTHAAKIFLQENWKSTKKIYCAIVHGHLAQKAEMFSSYLIEDDDYLMHAASNSAQGKLAQTAYSVIKETSRFSVVEISLLTGKKNQIRVHFADAGHPVVGDTKYGARETRHRRLALHAQSITFTHPFSKKRLTFCAELPQYFHTVIGS